MADNSKVELVVQVDVDKANQNIRSVTASLSGVESSALRVSRGASQGIDGMTASVARGAAAGTLLAHSFERLVGWIKESTVEVAKYAARTETLSIVTNQLSRVNGYNESSVNRLVGRVKELGITTQEAQSTVQRMIFAQLDLSKATELARVAQDAAVIANENSSEALEHIILGITTGQTRLLHMRGLQVSLEQTIQEEQRKLGRALSETEKREAMLNKVLQEGIKIRGTYESSMQSVGKQLTSMPRYWLEAKNAIGENFLPEMRKAVSALTEVAKWLKENADAVALWAKGIASAAIGAAVAKFITWMAGAKKAVDALTISLAKNPFTAIAIAAAVAGTVLYDTYQKSLAYEKQLKEENKLLDERLRITYQLEKGAKFEDLQKMGYSIDQIQRALLGAKEGAEQFFAEFDKDHFANVIKLVNLEEERKRKEEEAKKTAEELAKDMAKKRKDIERDTYEAAQSAQRALLNGPAKIWMEYLDKRAKASQFVDKDGNIHEMRLSQKTEENLLREHQLKMQGYQKESLNDTLKLYREQYEERLKLDTELYQKQRERVEQRFEYDHESMYDATRQGYEIEESRVGMLRDKQLRELEAFNAQTVDQKIWVENRKAEIEIEHLEKTHNLKMKLFDLETSRTVMEEEFNLQRLGFKTEEIAIRIRELEQLRDQLRLNLGEQNDAAVKAAKENASTQSVRLARDANMRIFQSLKEQAGGVFDALLVKSQSTWEAIANSLKTALLTAIKDVVTSRIAAMLMQLFTGQMTTLQGGGRLGGLLGLGAVPVFGSGGGTPPFVPSGSSGVGSLGGLAGGGIGLKSLFGISGSGSLSLGGGAATTWSAATLLQKLQGVGRSNAALLGGGMLALDGLRRGGLLGLGETTAGGAMIGFKFGGSLGAAVGAGVGALTGIVRLFMKSAEEKTREKIKSVYGIDVSEKTVLKQIVEIARSTFGGNIDMAIRSTQIREIITLYGMSTGKPVTGMPRTMTPSTLIQTGGSLFQSPSYQNGAVVPGSGGLPTFDSVGRGTATNAGGTVVVPLQIDSKSVGSVIIQNGRVITQGAINAMKGNAGRREMASLQLSPGTLTS